MKPTTVINPKTIGDHIRKKRCERGISQREVSKLIGVSKDCITYWENNRTEPHIKFMPAIIKFLGSLPIEIDTSTIGGRILLYSYQNGLSHKKLGKILGVDSTTIRDWERNLRIPSVNLSKMLKVF